MGRVGAMVDNAIARVRAGEPAVIDLEAHAGFGKTHLARRIAADFPSDRVLRATAYEDTQDDPLGILRQFGVTAEGVSPNALSASQALAERIDALEGDEPVLLLLDDLHWADPESLDAVGVLMERMAGHRVLLVAAHRPTGSRRARWLSRLHHLPAVTRVVLDGLDAEATHELVREYAPEATPELAESLREHTGGSPLFLRSLLHEYPADELRLLAERGGLPAPKELVAAMGERLSRLDPTAVAVLSAIAVVGGGGAEEFVLRAVADVQDLAGPLDLLTSEGLVVVDRAGASARVRIFHGVVQAAVYDNVPPATRERMHAAAAARLPSPEARLRHRVAAASRADDGLAADLSAFADALHERARYREAARFRREAARFSPDADDAIAHVLEADVEAILALDLDEVSVDQRAVALDASSRFISGMRLSAQKRFVAASDRLESLTDAELGSFSPVNAYRARVLRAWSLVAAGRSPHAALHDLEAARASGAVDPAVRGYAAMAQGQAEQRITPLGEGATMADLLAADRSQLAATPQGVAALAWRGAVMALTGMAKDAIGDLGIVTSRFGEGQVDFGDGLFHGLQGFAHFINGEWARAAMMIGLSRAGGVRYPAPLTGSIEPLASVVAGDADRARAGLLEARRLRIEGPHPAAVHAGDVVDVLTLFFMGDDEERAAWLEGRVRDLGSPEVWADEHVPHLWYVAQAIGAEWAGRPEAAQRWVRLLRAVEPTPWSADAADWLEARSDPSPEGVGRLLRRADLGIAQSPTLHAMLLFEAAQRAPSDPERVRAAAAGLQSLGAGPLAARLPRLPSSAARDVPERSLFSALSDREREVAALVLEGLSYSQVAKELFITRSTVSFHLSRIYAKTGTASRHELIQAVRESAP